MDIFKRRTKLAALTALVLGGCASPYWQQDPAWAGYKPTQISVVEKDDPSQFCSAAPQSVWGCAVRQREMNHCIVFIKASLPYEAYGCTMTHEVRHCFGEQHDAFNALPHYAIDCGNGEIYTASAQAGR